MVIDAVRTIITSREDEDATEAVSAVCDSAFENIAEAIHSKEIEIILERTGITPAAVRDVEVGDEIWPTRVDHALQGLDEHAA